jgi:5-methylcytosine-specific restriction endonuclease McrA
MPRGVYKHKKHTEEWKRKVGLALKGRVTWIKGKHHTKETRRKMSEGRSGEKNCNWGKHLSEETRKKLSQAIKGKKHTEETKRKIGLASLGNKYNLGRKASEETKRKMSETHLKKHFSHSEETKKKISEAKKGEKSYCWKGGISTENEVIRRSIELRLWREAVFARDNFTCQKTGQVGGKLTAHHIKNFSEFPELRTSIENGITLSDKVHREFHHIYGIKNNNQEQLNIFLIN